MIEKIVLPNGLTVLLQRLDSVMSASAGLWIKTGSRHEGAGEYGYAHFLEHMLFKGTAAYSAPEIARMVDRVGGQHNGATNKEYTCYYINLIADHLPMALDLLAEMYYRPLLADADIEKEKGIVLEEIRMYEDSADEHALDLFMECMFAGHPLAHNILGTKESIASLTPDSLRRFYGGAYATSRAILSIAGNIDTAKTKALILERFGELRTGGPALGDSIPVAQRVYRRHIDRDIEQVHLCLGFEGISRHRDDRYAMYLFSTIFGGSSSSRLFQNIREKEGLCYSVFSFHSSYHDDGVFGVYCGTAPENFDRARELILDECRLAMRQGITADELSDAKAYMKGNLALSLESTEVRMGHAALEEMTYGRQFSFEEISQLIDKVTVDDVHGIIAHIFSRPETGYITIGRLAKPGDSILRLY